MKPGSGVASLAILIFTRVPEQVAVVLTDFGPHVAIVAQVVDIGLNFGKTEHVEIAFKNEMSGAFVEQ